MKRLILVLAVGTVIIAGFATSLGQNVSDDARRHFDRGAAAVEMAKTPADYEAAIAEFKQAIDLAPEWADAYYNLGKVQEQAEKFADAIASLRQYLHLAPAAPDAETVKSLINKLEYKKEQEEVKRVAVHYIGENYGGGIVFYVYDGGHHGLIAATADQSVVGINWFGASFANIGAGADGVGAGSKNTAVIIKPPNEKSDLPSYYAARVCNEYSVTVVGITYGDWYLPSKIELNLLYLRKSVVSGFAGDDYWSSYQSSNEDGAYAAWYQNFNDGKQSNANKHATSYVRAVRAF